MRIQIINVHSVDEFFDENGVDLRVAFNQLCKDYDIRPVYTIDPTKLSANQKAEIGFQMAFE